MMKKLFALASLVTLAAPVFAVDEAAAMDIAKKSNCMACHALDKKLVGPAWKDVGKRYAGDAAAEEQLIAKVKKGTKGTWGSVPMPPNATVKDDDIKTLVRFILTMK